MKKRKFPAGLIIALIVLVGGAGAYSAYNTKRANMTPEQLAREAQEAQMKAAMANAPKPDANAAPPSISKDDVRASVVANTQKRPAEGGPPPGRGGPGGGPGGEAAAPGSSILAPKAQPYKPVPNDSATSSQWFNKK